MTRSVASPKKTSLAARVSRLERELAAVQKAVKARPAKDWQRTIGMFGHDPIMKQIFDEAAKFREKDRQRARRRYAKKGAK
jgi:hypothetical protein